MSDRTHPVCDPCWRERPEAQERVPTRVMGAAGVCCFCGKHTNGIFVRGDPAGLKCEHDRTVHVPDEGLLYSEAELYAAMAYGYATDRRMPLATAAILQRIRDARKG